MENSVEKTFDDMLDSVKSINDDFVNSYFNDEEIAEIIKENKDETEEVEEDEENTLVENSVDNVETDSAEEVELEDNTLNLSDFDTFSVENFEKSPIDQLIKDDYTEEELLDLIDETDSSEEFFNRLEGK